MADTGQEKTESPTPRRRQEARESGNVARSVDLVAAAALLAAVIVLYHLGGAVFRHMHLTVDTMLRPLPGHNPTRIEDVDQLLGMGSRLVVSMAAPIALGVAAVTLLASLAQVGLMFTLKPLTPSLNKLNPITGLARLFDARAGMRLVMSLLKLAALVAVSVWVIMRDFPKVILLCHLEVLPMMAAAAAMAYDLALKLAMLLLILALLDWWYQRWQHEKDLRMTKQEVKDEMKRMDGDPMVKQRRARVARQLALQRIASAVPHADVVVTNPTHYAVALRYDSATMTAPKVVAKGADFLALRIRQLAVANGVPLVERRELARALYHGVEPGQEVPAEFYTAVAEILAYVYRLGGRMAAAMRTRWKW